MAYKQSITDCNTIRVSAGYPAYPDGSPHRGIDTVHCNHKAYAPADGVVEIAQVWDGHTTTGDQSWGNMIKVRMADGHTWRAAHFAAQLWSSGATIKKGDYIGEQGRTGNATGIHTHWEYQDSSGNLLDPSAILGIPNSVGTWDVEWDAGGGGGPGPDPGKLALPIWLLFKIVKGGRPL